MKADFHTEIHAEFHLRREQTNQLEYGRVKDPNRSVHFHSQIEVYLVLEGEVEVFINNSTMIIRKEDFALYMILN